MLLAANPHHGQHRKDQQGGVSLPYLVHPLDVMKVLWSWGVADDTVLAAAALHDVFEDTEVTGHVVHDACGIDVYNLVAELTRPPDVPKEEYIKSFADPAKTSVEAVVVKVADRICNVRDFLRTDFRYAGKYLLQARALNAAVASRYKEAVCRFGNEVTAAMRNDWFCLVDKTGVVM